MFIPYRRHILSCLASLIPLDQTLKDKHRETLFEQFSLEDSWRVSLEVAPTMPSSMARTPSAKYCTHPALVICLPPFLFPTTPKGPSTSVFPSESLHNFQVMMPLRGTWYTRSGPWWMQGKRMSCAYSDLFSTYWNKEVPLKSVRKFPLEDFLNGK